jgi:hypothetical protein
MRPARAQVIEDHPHNAEISATRYDKLAVRYETTITITNIDTWLRRLERHLRNTAQYVGPACGRGRAFSPQGHCVVG